MKKDDEQVDAVVVQTIDHLNHVVLALYEKAHQRAGALKPREGIAFFDAVETELLLTKALCHYQLKEWDECVGECEKVLRGDPHSGKALVRKARALLEIGKEDEAMRALKEASSLLGPREVEVHACRLRAGAATHIHKVPSRSRSSSSVRGMDSPPNDVLDPTVSFKELANSELPAIPAAVPDARHDMARWQQFQRLVYEYQSRKLSFRYEAHSKQAAAAVLDVIASNSAQLALLQEAAEKRYMGELVRMYLEIRAFEAPETNNKEKFAQRIFERFIDPDSESSDIVTLPFDIVTKFKGNLVGKKWDVLFADVLSELITMIAYNILCDFSSLQTK